MRFTASCFALLFALFPHVNSLKLLLVFPLPAKSHYILGNELGKGLAGLGHDVTVLSAFEDKNPPKNYKEIVVKHLYKEEKKTINMFDMENLSPFVQLFFMNGALLDVTERTLNSTEAQKLIHSNERFDAVIVEQFWNDAFKGFAPLFNAHLIAFSTIGPCRWVNNLVSNPDNPSYIPDMFLSFGSSMTFYQRLYNFIFGLTSDLLLYNYHYPAQNALLQKYFPNPVHLDQLQYNVSLVLTNSHESINAAVPHVPNMINIGGYHVNPPKELPEDLKQFLDNSKNGVIYFSLGSNLVPSSMPKDKKDIILEVLGSRKENVLWKWDEPELENKPSNVMIKKWFPQQAVLAHPNCILFISHGGLLSTTEAATLGVPILAFPIFGDQKLNANRIKSKGFGSFIPFSQITKESLNGTLNEMLEHPSYREKAELTSRLIHDRPMKPIEIADFWIKYVVRNNGAPHLRVASVDLPLYKYYMLDIFAVIFTVLGLVVYLLGKVLCLIFRKKTKSPKTKKE